MRAPSLGCRTVSLGLVKDDPEILKYICAFTVPYLGSSFCDVTSERVVFFVILLFSNQCVLIGWNHLPNER